MPDFNSNFVQNWSRVGLWCVHVQLRVLQEEGNRAGHVYRRLPVRRLLSAPSGTHSGTGVEVVTARRLKYSIILRVAIVLQGLIFEVLSFKFEGNLEFSPSPQFFFDPPPSGCKKPEIGLEVTFLPISPFFLFPPLLTFFLF